MIWDTGSKTGEVTGHSKQAALNSPSKRFEQKLDAGGTSASCSVLEQHQSSLLCR